MIDHERLQHAVKHTKRRNCIGTALYLTHCVSTDDYIDPDDFDQFLEPYLPRQEQPTLGCLVSFHDSDPTSPFLGDTQHMAVVTKLNPLLLTHRKNYEKPVEEHIPSERITENTQNKPGLKQLSIKHYYTPTALHSLP